MDKRNKTKPVIEPVPGNDGKPKRFKKFAYALAWIYFIANCGLAIFEAVKEHEPPVKDDYFR